MDVRERLEAERQRLLALLADLPAVEEGTGELSAIDQHPADAGTEVFDEEESASLRTSVQGELADVERALGRLEQGQYGICEICGQAISQERLEAIPTARLCVRDQARVDAEGQSPQITARDMPIH